MFAATLGAGLLSPRRLHEDAHKRPSERSHSSDSKISRQEHSETFEPGNGLAMSSSNRVDDSANQADADHTGQQISANRRRKRKTRSDEADASELQQRQKVRGAALENTALEAAPPGEDKLLWYIDHIQRQRSEAERLRSEAEATTLQWKNKYTRAEAELNALRAHMDLFFAVATEIAPTLLNIVNVQLLERTKLHGNLPQAASAVPKVPLTLPRLPAAPHSAPSSLSVSKASQPYAPRPLLQQSWVQSTNTGPVPPQNFMANHPTPSPLNALSALQARPQLRPPPVGSRAPQANLQYMRPPSKTAPLRASASVYPNLALSKGSEYQPRPLQLKPTVSTGAVQTGAPVPAQAPQKRNSTLAQPKPCRPVPTVPDASAFRVVRASARQKESPPPSLLQQQSPSAAAIFEMAKNQAALSKRW